MCVTVLARRTIRAYLPGRRPLEFQHQAIQADPERRRRLSETTQVGNFNVKRAADSGKKVGWSACLVLSSFSFAGISKHHMLTRLLRRHYTEDLLLSAIAQHPASHRSVCFEHARCSAPWASAGGKRASSPLEIGSKILQNLKSAV